jgi:hypothetical protein
MNVSKISMNSLKILKKDLSEFSNQINANACLGRGEAAPRPLGKHTKPYFMGFIPVSNASQESGFLPRECCAKPILLGGEESHLKRMVWETYVLILPFSNRL